MDFIEDIRICEERAATGFGAEIDRPAAIFEARKIRGIGIPELSPTQRHEAREFLLLVRIERHTFTAWVPLPQ